MLENDVINCLQLVGIESNSILHNLIKIVNNPTPRVTRSLGHSWHACLAHYYHNVCVTRLLQYVERLLPDPDGFCSKKKSLESNLIADNANIFAIMFLQTGNDLLFLRT